MKKLWRWLKAVNAAAKKRAELILAARQCLADMDGHWREVNTSNDDVAVLLLKIGLVHLQAVYQGQMAAQNVIRAAKRHLN